MPSRSSTLNIRSSRDSKKGLRAVAQMLRPSRPSSTTGGRPLSLPRDAPGGSPTSALNVQNDKGEDISVNLAEANKPTVLVFFATWCPHCQNEMPKLVKFVESMDTDKAQFIGVRTSVEREKMTYSEFKAQYKPNFPIYTDATMSLAFGKFARDEQTVASMPACDPRPQGGVVQFILKNGLAEDPVEQIQWALEEVQQF